jgi:hypothetical protein
MAQKKDLKVFGTFEESDRSNRAEVAAMSPEERVDIALELIRRYREGCGEAGERLARVCRVAQFEKK